MDNVQNWRKINSAYRLVVLRVCSAFRTSSDDAVFVIAGMVLIDLLAREMRCLYGRRQAGPSGTEADHRRTAKEETHRLWQRRWDELSKGRWTYKLIPDIREWLDRRHGEVNYHLTQFLTGHGGCYRTYLPRIGVDDSPNCYRCRGIPEDPVYVLFECPRFREERRSLSKALGIGASSQNLIREMLRSEANWTSVIHTIVRIQTQRSTHKKSAKKWRGCTLKTEWSC